MRVSRKLVTRVSLVSGFFILLIGLLAVIYVNSLFIKKMDLMIDAETKSMSQIVDQFYGMGDLVNLKANLNSLVVKDTVLESSFVNQDGEKIWEWSRNSNEMFSDPIWRVFSDLFFDTKTENISLTKVITVKNWNSEPIGRLTLTKAFPSEWDEHKGQITFIALVVSFSWIFYSIVLSIVAKLTLKPLNNMLSEIRSISSKIALDLRNTRGEDEIERTSRWFRELANAWEEKSREAIVHQRNSAIASTTQMLAHDVRKPFSMMTAIIDSLEQASSFSETKEILDAGTVEVKAALTSVTGMLQDVMEAGSKTTLNKEPTSVSTILDATIKECHRIFQDCNVTFHYDLRHESSVEIDTLKIQRVFSNIVGNAIQATKGMTEMTFATREQSGFIEFSIRNTESFIPKEDVDQLFEAFFTKGKKGGTGLGLMISKKFVEAHGGQIRCESSPEIGVKFVFTLPIAARDSTPKYSLPKNSAEVYEVLKPVKNTPEAEMGREEIADELEKNLAEMLEGRLINIVIMDDEAIYRNALKAMISKLKASSSLKVLAVSNSDEALEAVRNGAHLGIFDFDLGAGSKNGLETLEDAQKINPEIKVCIHSNRMKTTHNKLALEQGAFSFLLKPMSKVSLLRFLVDAISEIKIENQSPQSHSAKSLETDKPIAILDDSKILLRSWEVKNKGKPLSLFTSPEDFWKYQHEHPEWFDALDFIVTDNNFGKLSEFTGLEFAQKMTGKTIYLCSNEDFSETPPGITAVLKKETLRWAELQNLKVMT